MKSLIFCSLALFLSLTIHASTHLVGATKTYLSPNALYNANVVSDGDSILIDGGVYAGDASLAVWQQDNLVFIGSVDGVQTSLVAEGKYIWEKGIWVVAGSHTTIEGIEFSGAQVPDFNGAGIRLDGSGLTVRYCHFHHNEMGILTNNADFSTVLIEHTEFGYNGYGDGYSHNIYVNHVDTFIFRYNYSHHSVIGHTLKSRARNNFISYNRFADGLDGNSSRLIDLPNGGFSIVMGNELIQGPNAENINMLGYGLEGNTNSGVHQLFLINNTFVNKKTTNGLFLHLSEQTEYSLVANNVFTGVGTLVNGNIDGDVTNEVSVDWSGLGFVDVDADEYGLSPESMLVDAGSFMGMTIVGEYALTPDQEYVHPFDNDVRTLVEAIDIGAHEVKVVDFLTNSETLRFNIYPNPSADIIKVELLGECNESPAYKILDSQGNLVAKGDIECQEISIAELPSGWYTVIVGTQYGRFVKIK